MTVGELIKELIRLDVHLPVYVHEDYMHTVECSELVHAEENGENTLIIQ